jgi:hypothetical protein
MTFMSSLSNVQRSEVDKILKRVDEAPRYERDRSASPRPSRRNDSPPRARRSASPGGNGHVEPRSVSTTLTQHMYVINSF